MSLTTSAQETHSFSKPLKLLKVEKSDSPSDSLLVYSANKRVKFVPKSEFSVSQTLQQTLNNGYQVVNTPIHINRTDGIFQDGFKLLSPSRYTSLQDGYFRIYNYDGSGETTFSNGSIHYSQNGENLHITFPTIDNNLNLPLSINGVFADTNGNIQISAGGAQNLQEVIDTGNTVTNSIAQFRNSPFTTASEIAYNGFTSITPSLGERSLLQQGLVTSSKGYGPSEISIRMGYHNIAFSKNTGRIQILTTPDVADVLNSDIKISLPYQKPTGNYFFATTDDIKELATSNPTSTALTNSDLNSIYPTAHLGLRVHCIDISEGAVIYEKVSNGWVKYSVEFMP